MTSFSRTLAEWSARRTYPIQGSSPRQERSRLPLFAVQPNSWCPVNRQWQFFLVAQTYKYSRESCERTCFQQTFPQSSCDLQLYSLIRRMAHYELPKFSDMIWRRNSFDNHCSVDEPYRIARGGDAAWHEWENYRVKIHWSHNWGVIY
jgi:hypothetical protein